MNWFTIFEYEKIPNKKIAKNPIKKNKIKKIAKIC